MRPKTMAQAQRNSHYLTKRVLKRATAQGIKQASEKASDVADSYVVVNRGWVVRRFKDGRVVKLEKLQKVKPNQIVLD